MGVFKEIKRIKIVCRASISGQTKKSTLNTIVHETITSLRLPDHAGALRPDFLTTALGQLL